MFFASDNWAGVHQRIAERLMQESAGYADPYGESLLDRKAEARISEMLGRDVAVFFVATGTAANAIALSSVNKVAGVAFCHNRAHIIHHEGGAVELMTNGAKLVAVDGDGRQPGKMAPDKLSRAIGHFPDKDVHVGQKIAVSISQLTESGTTHSIDEIRTIADIAHEAGISLHMDGARFSNAVAALGVSPAEMTWKAGVDLLSLGGTKNGCWCAEAVVVMDPGKSKIVPHLRKRGGQLFSKSRFVAAQFDAWLEGGLWLEIATHANAMGKRLRDAVSVSRSMRLAWPTQANQSFIIMKKDKAQNLLSAGARFYDWEKPDDLDLIIEPDEGIYRFTTSYATIAEDIDRFAALAG